MNFADKTILVTGGAGFLGREVVKALKNHGVKQEKIIIPRSAEFDLRDQAQAMQMIKKFNPDKVIHLAARLGGIGDNMAHPAAYFYDNMMLGINIIEACRTNKVNKLVNIGTVCSYPKIVPAPFKEEDLWNGYPEETNAPYGVSKKAVMVYAEAVNREFGFNTVNLLVTNLYGPGDDFREQTSHVIPAIIKKMDNAKRNGDAEIIAWGDGSPSRDFVYVSDAAEGIVRAAALHNSPEPVNIGAGEEYTIKQLMEILKEETGFMGEIKWDTSRPNGQPRRLLDISRARNAFGFNPATGFREGLKNTYNWYLSNYDLIHAQKPKFAESRQA
ncbi:MAG: GDP-L-fucose synthase [Bacteroidetes bacterium]|nr:GDP-L-fucose synthase [Bacteroidota bacterium]